MNVNQASDQERTQPFLDNDYDSDETKDEKPLQSQSQPQQLQPSQKQTQTQSRIESQTPIPIKNNNDNGNNCNNDDLNKLTEYIVNHENNTFINQFNHILEMYNNNQNNYKHDHDQNDNDDNDQNTLLLYKSILSFINTLKLTVTSIKYQNIDILKYLLGNNVK